MKYIGNSLLASVLAIAVTTSFMLSASFPIEANAAFYKCIDEEGNTTYNDRPCAANESTRLLSKQATTIEALDCRIARNFMTDTNTRLQRGETREDIFMAYDGARALSKEVLNMINFLVAFEGRTQSVNRIFTMATQRCESGLFGARVEFCETYPDAFIDSVGGCNKARQIEDSFMIRNLIPDSASNSPSQSPALGAAKPVVSKPPYSR